MAYIRMQNLVKSFDRVRVIENINLDIETGELFFLLGPSGCGKTTLLRILAGFYQPDSGQVFINNKDVTTQPPHKRNAGMVFQNYALWPHMTIRQNLEFGLQMHKVKAAARKKRVDATLQMVQMQAYADRFPNQLSGGQQQRVALGRALVLEPEVVLLDEPLSNLDAKLRLEMREQIQHLHSRLNLTMIYVTHDQSEALTLADRIAIMKDGKIHQIGTPREIYNQPASHFVANFIGETNFIEGKVKSIGETFVVTTPAGELRAGTAYDGIQVGDAVWCSIRPERLNVVLNGETKANLLQGVVARVVYSGNHEQYFFQLPNNIEVTVLEYNLETSKSAPGETAKIGCDVADVLLLRKEA
jgi:iron(III) transport system ATP-binding protein